MIPKLSEVKVEIGSKTMQRSVLLAEKAGEKPRARHRSSPSCGSKERSAAMALPAWLLGLAVVRLSSTAALQFICGGAELLGEVMYANLPPSLLKILPSGIWPKTSPGMNHQPPLFVSPTILYQFQFCSRRGLARLLCMSLTSAPAF